MQQYDLVVMGDEPAGLWLLHQYSKAMQEHGGPGKVAWVSLETEHRPRSIPSLLASAFELQAGESWNLEILSPQKNLTWHPTQLRALFPSLPDPLLANRKDKTETKTKLAPEDLLHWDKAWLAEVRKTLARHPELFSYSQAVWKWMGRSIPAVSEAQFIYSYRFHDFSYWDPSSMVPADVTRIALKPGTHAVEGFKSSGGVTHLTFREYDTIASKRWVWNLPWKQLTSLCRRQPDLFEALNPSLSETCAPDALYGLRIQTEASSVPVPMRPVSIYMDDWLIPDPHSEMWPVQLFSFGDRKELCVWSQGPVDVSLEATQSSFTAATQRLYRLLPFLSRQARSFSIGLDSECSFDERTRREWYDRLYETRIELYRHTVREVGARHGAFSLLLPVVDCHLPYPFGTLQAAQRLVKDWVPKKKKTKEGAAEAVAR